MAIGNREGKGLDGFEKGEKTEKRASFQKVATGIWLGSDNEFYTVSPLGEMIKIKLLNQKDCEVLDVTWETVKHYQSQKKAVGPLAGPTQQEPKPAARPVACEVEQPGTKALALRPDMVRPVVSVQEAVEAWKEFQDLKSALLTKDDLCDIGGKPYVRKSGLRKIKTCFNISLQVIDDKRRELEGGDFEYTAYVKATAPNGTSVEAIASCNSMEPFGDRQKKSAAKQSNIPLDQLRPETVAYAIRSMAQTRAYNRAISDLIGGGEISAEEVE